MNGLALCAGVAGLELGLSLAIPGYRTVAYVEREAYAAALVVARMEDEALDIAPVWDDLDTFDGRPWRGVVDIVSAGFPCQPWSVAGKRRGTEDERWLWPVIQRILGEVGPRFVFLENVPGLLKSGLGAVLGGLAALGYDAEWGVFSAGGVGAPHRRERVFVLAIPKGRNRRQGDSIISGESQRDFSREEGRWGTWRFEGRSGEADVELGDQEKSSQGDWNTWESISRGGRDVGNPDCASHQGRNVEGAATGESGQDDLQIPTWPPGPADLAGWREVLSRWPSLEPAVRRVADGPSDRMDRLRALGNGVVPLAAAHALRTLAAWGGWNLK